MNTAQIQHPLEVSRKKRNLTLAALAEGIKDKFGISISIGYLSYLEAGQRTTTYEKAKAISDYFDGEVPLESLVSQRTLFLLRTNLTTC